MDVNRIEVDDNGRIKLTPEVIRARREFEKAVKPAISHLSVIEKTYVINFLKGMFLIEETIPNTMPKKDDVGLSMPEGIFWACSKCNATNLDTAQRCVNCGAPKGPGGQR